MGFFFQNSYKKHKKQQKQNNENILTVDIQSDIWFKQDLRFTMGKNPRLRVEFLYCNSYPYFWEKS